MNFVTQGAIYLPGEDVDGYVVKEGELVILSMDLITRMVEDISKMDLDEVAEDVNKDPVKWTTMRELKRF